MMMKSKTERSWQLVGALLTHIDSLSDVRDLLDPDDLSGAPSLVYEAICELEHKSCIDACVRWVEAERKWDRRMMTLETPEALGGLIIRACSAPYQGNVRALAADIKREVIQSRLTMFLYTQYQQAAGPLADLGKFFDTLETSLSDLRPTGDTHAMTGQEAAKRVLRRHEEEDGPTTVLTGLIDLDRFVSLDPGRLVVIAARPGMGKSALALEIARRAAHLAQPVFVASGEMSPDECYARIIAAEGQLNSQCVSKATTPDHLLQRLTAGLAGVAALDLRISETAGQTIFGISSLIRREARSGAQLAVIDYLGLVGPAKGQPKEAWALKGDNMRHLKLLARRLEIPIIVLVQANQRVEQRGNKRVTLGDLHGSGEIAMHADVVATLYREEVYNDEADDAERGICEVSVVKNRAGQLGRLLLKYRPEWNRFDNHLAAMEGVG
jgi:replicative DNA helicase